MANKVFKESFTGKYDGVTPATLLPKGALSDGANVRRVAPWGGWKARKGCALHNTSVIDSTNGVDGLHRYVNPKGGDYHFLAQCNSKLYDSPQGPPTPAADTAWTDLGVTVGTGDSFSCVVNESFYYADGSGRPVAWGGDTPYPIGVFSYDLGSSTYNNITNLVVDANSGTEGFCFGAATDKIYIVTAEPCEALGINMGATVNSNAVTMTLGAWRSTTFTGVSALSDGTETGGTTTLAQDAVIGTNGVTWTGSASDTVRVIGNTMGYVYELGWSGALSGTGVTIVGINVVSDANPVTNKWNGYWEDVVNALFYDASGDGASGVYEDHIQNITNQAITQYMDISLMQTGDKIYIKTPEPATGFAIAIVAGFHNETAGNISAIKGWTGAAFSTATLISDGTLNNNSTDSFAKTGRVFFNASTISVVPMQFQGDSIPGYWYEISIDLALSDDTRIFYMNYAPFPDTFPVASGVVEFKSRLFFWGPEKPNQLGYTSRRRGDCFAGFDSWYTAPFGDQSKILRAMSFYNELLVFKRDKVYFLEGYDTTTLGTLKISDTVGLSSPKTAHVVEVGTPGMHKDEPMSIAIWQAHDGVYILDGRKPRKVSMPVDHYFNPEYSTCIPAANIQTLEAFIDKNNNEYHLLLPTAELVYNYATDEWYPPWERNIDLTCGLRFKGADNRYHAYGGDANGFVYRTESDTADKTVGNTDVAISHNVKTRAIPATEKASLKNLTGTSDVIYKFNLRKLWPEMKARTAGSLTTKTFKNLATNGTTQATPEAASMINTGYSMAMPRLDMNPTITDSVAFQAEFTLATVYQEMEIWSLIYELEIIGEPNV